MNKKRMLILAALAVAVIGALFAYNLLTPKGELDIAKEAASHEVTASALYAAFDENEATANEKYAGAVITVSGVLQAVDENEAQQIQISLASENDMGVVLCTLQKTPKNLDELKIGSSVTVKGVCTGYLFDVVIDQAILL